MSAWQVLKSKLLMQAGIFRLRTDECRLPDGRVMPNYYVFEFPDWVNVVPITADGQMILVRQHRHAAEQDFLEIPGGSTHSGVSEDPQRAAERELLEETGYESKQWIHCGTHYPNPALQNNRMHTYLAVDCKKVAELSLDPFEDLTVELMPIPEALKLWQDGGFKHSLISASIGMSLKALAERNYSGKPSR